MDEEKENVDPDFKDFQPLKRKRKGTVSPTKRFKASTRENEIDTITKGYVPDNTKRSTSWAVNVFKEWKAARKYEDGDKKCPDNLFDIATSDELNYWLPRFVNEVRKADGLPYPPRSIQLILAGLQRHMLDINFTAQKFLDRQNQIFKPIHRACDFVYHSLHTSGIGTSVEHTSIITAEEEQKLWDHKIFQIDHPKGLQRAVFFYIGKRFCIRGGEEQRSLGPSQFIRSFKPDCFTYVEHGSTGRAKDLKFQNKEVPCPAIPECGHKCLVFLLDLYLSKLPKIAFEKDILYLRPKKLKPSDADQPWYESSPVGKNTLRNMVKDMFADVGVSGKTNHTTGATALFQNHIPERTIQKVTGHRSLEALRNYETVSIDQHKEVSKVLVSDACNSTGKFYGTTATGVLGGINSCSIGNLTINMQGPLNT